MSFPLGVIARTVQTPVVRDGSFLLAPALWDSVAERRPVRHANDRPCGEILGGIMTVSCAQCGEELLGAVNRCWRCGTTFALHADKSGLPPVRRRPVELLSTVPTKPQATQVISGPESVSTAPRQGSPFMAGTATPATFANSADPGSYVTRPLNPTTLIAAIIATLLGIIGLSLVNSVPFAAVAIALFAFGLAIWGLNQERRWVALIAIVLSLTAIGWGGYQSAIQIYVYRFGQSPWQEDEAFRDDPITDGQP